ncbi:MAG: hypothetical protein HDS29_05905 [Bacteroides sp.]|nr:hypothetical protein [Bacteroides sp.]
MKSCLTYIVCFFLLIILIGRCSNQVQKDSVKKGGFTADTLAVIAEHPKIKEIQSFIENTIYRTEDYDVHPIKDYRFTPLKVSYDGPIHVNIKENKAEIKAGNTYTSLHHIQSYRCYEVNDEKVAVLKTDKGEIQIIISRFANEPHIRFYIKSDSRIIGWLPSISDLNTN